MKESVDKKFKEHIISVFDSYDDGGAEQGWLELRRKYPVKAKKRYLLWWGSAAAILLVTGSLFFNVQKSAIKTKSQPLAGGKTITTLQDRAQKPSIDTLNAGSPNDYVTASAEAATIRNKPQPSDPATVGLPQIASNLLYAADNTDGAQKEQPLSERLQQPSENLNSLAAHKKGGENREPITDTSTGVRMPAAPSEITLATVDIEKQNTPPPTTDKTLNKKLELSFYAGAFVNYAEGSSNSMNMSAGVSSGIALSKRFTLVGGLALAKNTLVFENELPNTSYLAFVSAEKKGASLFLSGTVPHVSKLEASLLNLDIPVNIRYSLSRTPDKLFISAGLSSFAYLNEAYRYSYTNYNNGSNAAAPSDDEVISNKLGKFDFAQTLNFSFGLTQKGREQSIVVEPFIKYPLSTLGSQDIRFGSAGLNLKLQINPR